MNKSIPTLILRKESYRLWFEFYKLCCLSDRTDIRVNLKNTKGFYDSWGDVTTIKFDDWWKTHDVLFTEPDIKVLNNLSERQSDDSLIIEVPLNQSTSTLLVKFKELIETQQKPNYRKKKVRFTKSFILTQGSEPKLEKIRHTLNIYRDVYIQNGRPKIPKLLELTVQYYNSKKRMKIPRSIDESDNDKENVIKNLRLWMKNGDMILLNVSRGEFPGKY